jgi:hypothetical protein
MLLPGGQDTWWHLRVNEDNAGTIAEVVDVLVSVAASTLRGTTRVARPTTQIRGGGSGRISPWRTLIEQS